MKKKYKAKADLYIGYEMYLGDNIEWGWGEAQKIPLFRKGDIVEVDYDKMVSTKIREDYTEQEFYVTDGFVNLSNKDGQKRYGGFATLHTEELEDFFEEETN